MNKEIRVVDEIEQKIAKECKELVLNDESDRAELAWWIYQNFVKKMFIGGQTMPRRVSADEFDDPSSTPAQNSKSIHP